MVASLRVVFVYPCHNYLQQCQFYSCKCPLSLHRLHRMHRYLSSTGILSVVASVGHAPVAVLQSVACTELDSEPQAEAAALGPRAMAAPSVVECALGGPTKLSTLLWAGYAQRVLLHDTCWTHAQKFKQKECGPWGSGGVEIFLSLPLIAGPGRTPVVQFFCVHFFSHSSKDQGEP